jgi:hypothetical protein
VSALFPGYSFIHVEQLGRDISRLPGVIRELTAA